VAMGGNIPGVAAFEPPMTPGEGPLFRVRKKG